MSKAAFAFLFSTAGAQDIFQADVAAGIPTLDMKNAAEPNMKFPMIGLGTEGHGWQTGQTMECWHWPQCGNTIVDSVAAYIKVAVAKGGVARIDTGYPYGDNAKGGGTEGGCPKDIIDAYTSNMTARFLRGSRLNATVDQPLHASCDTHGIGLGIKKSGVSRDKIFVSAKVGYAGPMGGTKGQVASILHHMGVEYLDLCMVHFPEIGPGTGSHGQYAGQCPGHNCHCVPGKDYNAETCRYNTYKNMMGEMEKGSCKSVGVYGWTADQIDAMVKKGLKAPSVVQYKFHAHQSTANQIQKDLLAYTKQHGIIFNGIAPLGAPDWVTFTDAGMKPTILEEPIVQAIATNAGKSAAQVLLRWVVQQGIATQARTVNTDHMNENLGIFDFQLSSSDMDQLSGMPQCNVQRGNPYAEGDPNGGEKHGNVVCLTSHC